MTTYATPDQVLEAYIEGSRALDAERLRTCFRPDAVMNGYLRGRLLLGGPEPFFQDIAGMKAGGVDHSAFSAAVTSLAVNGDIAQGAVRMEKLAGQLDFQDYFHLVRDDDGWRIISKTFSSLD